MSRRESARTQILCQTGGLNLILKIKLALVIFLKRFFPFFSLTKIRLMTIFGSVDVDIHFVLIVFLVSVFLCREKGNIVSLFHTCGVQLFFLLFGKC